MEATPTLESESLGIFDLERMVEIGSEVTSLEGCL
jgi:hypothetical protein